MTLKKGLFINRSTDDVFYPQTSYDMIEDAPTCLPANGGDADTVDGKHADDLQNYENLTNKPTVFTPSIHSHRKSDITDFPRNLSAFDNDRNYQTEEQVKKLLSSLVNSAPETLDTLAELAQALGNDPNFATTISTLIGTKAPLIHKHVKEEITDFPISLPANGGDADTVDGKHADDLQNYENLTNKPTVFTPSIHSHRKSDITDFPRNLSAFDNDRNYQTEEQVKKLLSSLVNSAPETLDTLAELAQALGNDPNFATTISTLIGTKANTSDVNTALDKKIDKTAIAKTDTNDNEKVTGAGYVLNKFNAFDTAVRSLISSVRDEILGILRGELNQNRIELTNSSYYPTTVGYRSGQVVYLKCAGTLVKDVPANGGYVVALTMPAAYCPNVNLTLYPNIANTGKNIKVDIETNGKVTFTSPEKLVAGFGINIHLTYMTGKSNF